MKRDFNPNGYPYYRYMLCYVYDLLRIAFNIKEDINALNVIYWLKEIFGPPYRYIGANVEKLLFKDVKFVWSTKFADYLNIAIDNVDNSIGVDKKELKNYGDGHRP